MSLRACFWIAVLFITLWLTAFVTSLTGNPLDTPILVWMVVEDIYDKTAWYFYRF